MWGVYYIFSVPWCLVWWERLVKGGTFQFAAQLVGMSAAKFAPLNKIQQIHIMKYVLNCASIFILHLKDEIGVVKNFKFYKKKIRDLIRGLLLLLQPSIFSILIALIRWKSFLPLWFVLGPNRPLRTISIFIFATIMYFCYGTLQRL